MAEDSAKSKCNTVHWKEYVDTRFSESEKANVLQSQALNMRLEAMNEFRASMEDQSSKYQTCAESDAKFLSVEKDVRILRESKASLEGKASQFSVNIALLLSIVGVMGMCFSTVLAIIGLLLNAGAIR